MKIAFMGSPQFAVPALEACLADHEVVLVVTPAGQAGGARQETVTAASQRGGRARWRADCAAQVCADR